MKIALACIGVVLCLLLYVNVKLTKDIAGTQTATRRERLVAYFLVWLLPLVGVFFIPKHMLPRFYQDDKGHKYRNGPPGSGGNMPGGG